MPIRIKAIPPTGFSRCGKRHPAEWTEHRDGAFTEEQIAILQAEPMLQVELSGGGALDHPEATPTEVFAAAKVKECEELKKKVEQLAERLSQVELQRDGAIDEANILRADKQELETEIERLKRLVPAETIESIPVTDLKPETVELAPEDDEVPASAKSGKKGK